MATGAGLVTTLVAGVAIAQPIGAPPPPIEIPELAPPPARTNLEVAVDVGATPEGDDGVAATSVAFVAAARWHRADWVVSAAAGFSMWTASRPASNTADDGVDPTNVVLGAGRWWGRAGAWQAALRVLVLVPTQSVWNLQGPQDRLRIAALPWDRPGDWYGKLAAGVRKDGGGWTSQLEVGVDVTRRYLDTGSTRPLAYLWLGGGVGAIVTPRLAVTAHVVARYLPGADREDEGTAVGAGATVRLGPGGLRFELDHQLGTCDLAWVEATDPCVRFVTAYRLGI